MLIDRRSRLRSATQNAHRRLDAVVEDAGYFVDKASYAVYLEATLRARQPLERALHAYRADRLFNLWPARAIAAILYTDICDLTPGVCASGNPDVESPAFSAAQAIGTLYVLEGSALGARHLALRAQTIGMSATFGARHFAQQTAIPKSWSAFLKVLEAVAFNATEEDECVAAATAAFGCFERSYDR